MSRTDRAVVELDPGSSCARCAAGRGCGAALFSPRGRPVRLDCRVPDHLEVSLGQPVTLEIVDPVSRSWLVSVVLAYGLPTLGLLLGALVPEPWAPLGALAGVFGGILAWRAIARGDRAVPSGVLDVQLASVHPVSLTAPGDHRSLSGELP